MDGAVVGFERERASKAAGLRTHMLVAGGAAIFTVASAYLFDATGPPRDPARVAAQIVTGIGFLGAGAIIVRGISVRGLTTAATSRGRRPASSRRARRTGRTRSACTG